MLLLTCMPHSLGTRHRYGAPPSELTVSMLSKYLMLMHLLVLALH